MIKSMRFTSLILPVAAIAVLAACEDTTTVTEERFVPAAVLIRLDSQTLLVRADSVVTDTLVADSGANNLSFTLLRANGDTINTTIAGDSLFNVVVTPASGALTYTPQTNLSGILTGNTPGRTSFTFTIRRRNLTVFGPTTVPVVVVTNRPSAVLVRLNSQTLLVQADSVVRDTLVAERGPNTLSFTLLNQAGDTINTSITNEFIAAVTPASGALTYTPQTNLSGILTGNTPGRTSFTFSIRRGTLTVFGPTGVPVLVVPQ